jgi:hypothetical protein
MKPLYIFDLDGTLALIEYRRHFVENRRNRWDEFHAACVDDLPNPAIITLAQTLSLGADILIFSGRSDIVQPQTEDWLKKHDVLYFSLWMRKHGDYTPDDVLKQSWYDTLSGNDKRRLVCTFDDRDRVVAMWRRNGVTCCQVAPGDF